MSLRKAQASARATNERDLRTGYDELLGLSSLVLPIALQVHYTRREIAPGWR